MMAQEKEGLLEIFVYGTQANPLAIIGRMLIRHVGTAGAACELIHESPDEKKPQGISALGFFSYN